MSPASLPEASRYRRTPSTPGVVTFAVCSDTLRRGSQAPPTRLIAESLYTPPSAGWSHAVASLVPTPQTSITAPCS